MDNLLYKKEKQKEKENIHGLQSEEEKCP